MKKLAFIISTVVGTLLLGYFAFAQSISSPNYWRTNIASSTITPLNALLQVPCANIVGGCSGGSSPTINGIQTSTFYLIGDNSTITSTVSGATTTFSVIPNTFYPYTGNPSAYLAGVSASSPLSGSGTVGSPLIFTNPGYVTSSTGANYFAPSSTVSSQWTTTSTGIFYNGGNVGIGTAAPASSLSVNKSLDINGNLGNWVKVPGNPAFGTNDFYVMKYDAGCSDGNGNVVNTPTDLSYPGGYDYSTTPCAHIAALPGAIPIVDIAETTAKTACQSIGAHLMTNDEYMTIVTNAAAQGSNWTSGTVGTGGMYLGNANNGSEYPADPQDTNGYSNGTGGVMANQTVTNTGDERRTYTLSNGSVVWDMSGNVWEEVQRSNVNQGDNQSVESSPAYTGSSWVWGNFPSWSAWSTDPTTALTKSQVAPPNGTWTSAQGVGQLLGWGPGGTGGGTNAFIRGGAWSYGADVGPFSLYLIWGAGYTSSAVGFRCAR